MTEGMHRTICAVYI